MNMIGGTAACCAHATLAADEQTTQVKLAAQEETNQPATPAKFDWEQNAAKLRKLKLANSSLNRDQDS